MQNSSDHLAHSEYSKNISVLTTTFMTGTANIHKVFFSFPIMCLILTNCPISPKSHPSPLLCSLNGPPDSDCHQSTETAVSKAARNLLTDYQTQLPPTTLPDLCSTQQALRPLWVIASPLVSVPPYTPGSLSTSPMPLSLLFELPFLSNLFLAPS